MYKTIWIAAIISQSLFRAVFKRMHLYCRCHKRGSDHAASGECIKAIIGETSNDVTDCYSVVVDVIIIGHLFPFFYIITNVLLIYFHFNIKD